MQKIRKAIIPAAGFGTRFLPATKAFNELEAAAHAFADKQALLIFVKQGHSKYAAQVVHAVQIFLKKMFKAHWYVSTSRSPKIFAMIYADSIRSA